MNFSLLTEIVSSLPAVLAVATGSSLILNSQIFFRTDCRGDTDILLYYIVLYSKTKVLLTIRWKDGIFGCMQLVSFLKIGFENLYCIFCLGTFINCAQRFRDQISCSLHSEDKAIIHHLKCLFSTRKKFSLIRQQFIMSDFCHT